MGENAPRSCLDECIEIFPEVDLKDLGAGVLQPPNYLAEAILDFRVHQTQKLPRREGQSGSLEVEIPLDGLRSLLPGDDLVQQYAILNTTREHPRRVESVGDRCDAVTRPASCGRLEPYDTTQRRGHTDRSDCIATQGGGHYPGGHGCGRTA